MMYIPDPIERMETAAEVWSDEHIKGDMFKCDCGRMCKIIDGQPRSSHPYAPPICLYCFKELSDLRKK